jgi:PHP family Zn ribbon phosphoesterase
MLHRYKADLHVHTCLSPCGDLKMSPRNIVARAVQLHIDIIAICDHNSAENIPAVSKAAEGNALVVLPGMEVCTQEEVHVLAIFENIQAALEMQSAVYAHLSGKNDPQVFGMQVIANEVDEVEGFQERLLIGATDLPIEEVLNHIHKLGGLAIAAHIDREGYSVIGQLGFIPETLKFDALELTPRFKGEEAQARFADYRHHTFVRNSDAHFIQDVGVGLSEYVLERPSFSEIAKALRNEEGRRVLTA